MKTLLLVKNEDLIQLLNGPYFAPVIGVWVRSSTIQQSTTHCFLEKYEKYAINKKYKKYGKLKQFTLYVHCTLTPVHICK